ncbi:MAG: hypothetical protein AAGA95_16855, partial [Pseudomonadota bacterium]
YGRQAYLQRRISSQASIGRLFFSNAYSLFDNFGLTAAVSSEDAAAQGERRLEMAQTFRDLQRRLERVRAAALP